MPVRVETHDTLAAAAGALSGNRGARYFGGGTILMRAVNDGDQSFDTLIRTNDPALTQARNEGSRISIGGGVTMAQVIANRDLAVLHRPARAVGGPAVRSSATVGGNLFAHAPYGDFATALMALGATVHMAGQPESEVAIDDFMRDRARYADRIVRAVSIPSISDPNALRFLKVSRVKPKGVSVMTMAALLPTSSGRIDAFRIAYGNMGPVPVRAAAVERALEGASMDEAGVSRALSVATEGIDLKDDALASAWYRREVAPVHLKRLLLGTGG